MSNYYHIKLVVNMLLEDDRLKESQGDYAEIVLNQELEDLNLEDHNIKVVSIKAVEVTRYELG